VDTDLPVQFDLALALLALVKELVKLFMDLQECGLFPVLLRLLPLLLVVHCLPLVSYRLHPGHSDLGHYEDPGKTPLC
jgi:hypothetical protein